MKFHLRADYKTQKVWLNGKELLPEKSHKIYKHAPDFAWGYSGSGPSQLALAICVELFGAEYAQRVYQDFKFKYIVPLPETDIDEQIEIDYEFFNTHPTLMVIYSRNKKKDHD